MGFNWAFKGLRAVIIIIITVIAIRIQGGARQTFLPRRSEQLRGPPILPFDRCLRVNRPERKAGHVPVSSAEVHNKCSFTFDGATSWTVRGSDSCTRKSFYLLRNRTCGRRSLLFSGYRGSFAGGKTAEA